MDKVIYDYIKNGITIKGSPVYGYEVFTIPTQWFKIDSLHQLTPETFEKEIKRQKEHDEITSEIFKEVQNEIDQEILEQLRGGEPNPEIIPMNTIHRLYKNYRSKNHILYKETVWTYFEFIDKLLFDDDFYNEWGQDSCIELTDEERYNLWFRNNYETGMERYFNPDSLPDYENDYYEPTPKRKLKWIQGK